MGFTFNRARPLIEGHERSELMRPTWYSPPRQQQAKLQMPFNLFRREAYYGEPEENAISTAESDRFEEEMMAGSTSTRKLLVIFITKNPNKMNG